MSIATRVTDRGVIQERIDGPSSFIVEVPSNIGSGGSTIIPDEGTLSGTYHGTVVCEGDVYITTGVEVFGDVIVRGDFNNSVGAEVIIHGDLFAQQIYFDKDNKTTPQNNFEVDGDLIFTYMSFRQCGGQSALLRVGGDLIGSTGYIGTTLYGFGETDGTPGLNIVVYGDMTVSYVDVSGASGGVNPGGQGGHVTVYGSANIVSNFYASGGDATDNDAGSGGHIWVYGSFEAGNAYVYLTGGDGNNGNAGAGGDIYVNGNFNVDSVYLYGGDCDSDNENHASARGGDIDVDGDVTISQYINVSGGDRYGSLLGTGLLDPPDAGDVYVGGNLTMSSGYSPAAGGQVSFFGRGGRVDTAGYAPHGAGEGSNVTVHGDLVCMFYYANGGSASLGTAGAGGTLKVFGAMTADDDYAFMINPCEVELNGGDCAGANGPYAKAGTGGMLSTSGQINVNYLSLAGGNGTTARGGAGGTVLSKGALHVRNGIYVYGGDCDSTNEVHYAGAGGLIQAEGINAVAAQMDVSAGDRYGSTGSSFSNGSVDAGAIECYGDMLAYTVYGNGCNVSTDYPNGPGGSGGTVSVYGNLSSGVRIELSGGDSVGANGGSGGELFVEGNSVVHYVIANGGDSNDSFSAAPGSDATTNGEGGIMEFGGDLVAKSALELADGSGPGTVPSDYVYLKLNGTCNIYEISMTNRPECWIYSPNNMPVSLRVTSMPYKSTLNDTSGNVTNDISGDLDDSIFLSGGSSTWSMVTGTGIMAPVV